jgi:cytochrome c oxidase subunit 2
MKGIVAVRLFAAALDRSVNSPLVARVVLIVFAALLLAGCGGEKTVSPTGPVVGTLPKAEKGDPAAGKKAFLDNGCGGCHTFGPAGASGMIGPDLDKVLKGKSADFIKQSIVDPNAEIAPGFQPNIMPPSYGSQLSSKQIADLVAFLQTG